MWYILHFILNSGIFLIITYLCSVFAVVLAGIVGVYNLTKLIKCGLRDFIFHLTVSAYVRRVRIYIICICLLGCRDMESV